MLRAVILAIFMTANIVLVAQSALDIYLPVAQTDIVEESQAIFSYENLGLPKDLKLIALNTSGTGFYRTYLVDGDGRSISSGFMPSTNFIPNDNLVIFMGKPSPGNDSFNPYGARDLPSALLFATLNTFISKLRLGNRQPSKSQ